MKTVTYFLSILLFLMLNSASLAQIYSWAGRVGGMDDDFSMDMSVDNQGNSYIVGSFRGTNIDFDPGPGTAYLSSDGGVDIFFAKYDSSGNYLWARRIGGSNDDIGARIKIDGSSNVYIGGWFSSTSVDFDPGPDTAILSSAGATDIFFAKYDASGNYLWAKDIGSSLGDGCHDLALDGSNNVFITGYFYGIDTDFDPGPGTAYLSSVANSGDIFFAKYDSLGNYLWAKSAGGLGYEVGNSIATDDSNNVYLTGPFSGTNVDFNPGPDSAYLNSAGGYDIFLAKYDSSGDYVWAERTGGSGDDIGGRMAIGCLGDIYVAGCFHGTNIDFDSGPDTSYLNSAGGFDTYFAKYDAGGNYGWAKRIGGASDDFAGDLFVDGLDNVCLTGSFFGTNIDFDPGPGTAYLSSVGNSDIFFAKYDSFGNYTWAASVGGSGGDFGNGIGMDGSDNVYVTGGFAGTNVDFDPGLNRAYLSSAGGMDIFLAKYSPLRGPYLGQTPPDSIPVRFPPPSLLSDGIWWWHGSPMFSPDLKEMYWTIYLSDQIRTEISYMKLVNNEWTNPNRPSFASETYRENNPFFSPTGDSLYFHSSRPGGPFFIVIRDSSGWSQPQPINIPIPPSLYPGLQFSMAKNGTIYFELWGSDNQGDIYRSRLVNGQYSQPEKLGDQINTSYSEWSPYIHPEEEYIIFTSDRLGGFGSYDLYISFRNSDGSWTASQNLGSRINGTDVDVFPSVTPDGMYFFFTTAKTGDLGYNPYWVDAEFIEELRPDTTDSSFFDKIAFYSERDGNAEIYSMDVDGSGLERLTNNSAQDVCPAFSYDGSKIAFASNVDGNYEIYIMNYDGSDLRRLTNTPGNEMDPDWSPDGDRMVYSVFNTWDNGDIFMMNADGSNQHQLVNDPADDMMPVWSPDGDEIMFSAKRDGNYEIYVMDTLGNNQQRLTTSIADEVRPRWSPDGTRIAYAVVDHSSMTGQIHLMHADGSGDTVLTDAAGLNEAPCWSPDGAWIVFHSTRDGNYEIYTMNADGRNQHRLTNHSGEDGWPSWGRRCILGDANRDGNIDVGDVVYLVNYLFKAGPVPVPLIAGDSNNDEEVTISDVIYLINYLFKGGPRPSC